MAISKTSAFFQGNLQTVWDVVTPLDNYQWRSDLIRIEVVSEEQFIEYTKDGYATTFTITNTVPLERWEFDMENGNTVGHWTGVFKGKGGQTEIEFTEDVTAKKLIMKLFVKGYLKKQQKQYISDLQKALIK